MDANYPYSLDHPKFKHLANEEFNEWKKTDRGKWLMERAFNITTATAYDAMRDQFIGRICGQLATKDLTFYHLKWSGS